jgi:hypothetical protein
MGNGLLLKLPDSRKIPPQKKRPPAYLQRQAAFDKMKKNDLGGQ